MICSVSGIKPDLVHIRAFAEGSAISVFITGVIAWHDRATQYSAPSAMARRSRGVLGPPPSRGTTTGAAPPHAFFFTSLMLEKMMPSARSLV